jgi:hypothetical protein
MPNLVTLGNLVTMICAPLLYTVLMQGVSAIFKNQLPTLFVFRKVHTTIVSEETVHRADSHI